MSNNNNVKKVLCNNMIKKHVCSYGDKCLFAHSLEEQIKDKNKEYIYRLYEMKDLSNVNLNDELCKELLIMTKECEKCMNGICNGGINCKNGVCRTIDKICYDDLMHNNCCEEIINENRCKNGIHLSKKKLKKLALNYEEGVKNNKKIQYCIKVNENNVKNIVNLLNTMIE